MFQAETPGIHVGSCGGSLALEVSLVLSVCIVPVVFDSACIAWGNIPMESDAQGATFGALGSILHGAGALLLVGYLIHQRGERPRRFGFCYARSVIPGSLAVFILAWVAHNVTWHAARCFEMVDPESTLAQANKGVALAIPGVLIMLRIAISATFEETVVRSYLMTRLQGPRVAHKFGRRHQRPCPGIVSHVPRVNRGRNVYSDLLGVLHLLRALPKRGHIDPGSFVFRSRLVGLGVM